MTHALRRQSAAVDQGDSGSLSRDQRGRPRPVDLARANNPAGGDGADIGAFERGG